MINFWDSTLQCSHCSLSFELFNFESLPTVVLIAEGGQPIDFIFFPNISGKPVLVDSGQSFDNFAAFLATNDVLLDGRIPGSGGNPVTQVSLVATGEVPTAIGLTVTAIELEPLFYLSGGERQIIDSLNYHYTYDITAYGVPEPSCMLLFASFPFLLSRLPRRRCEIGHA